MTIKNKIKKQIKIIKSQTFLDPTLDPVFKHLFSVDKTLIHFLNAILHFEEETKIVSITPRNKVTVKLTSDEGSEMVRFDIHAKLNNGQYIDLEMQRASHSDLLDRIDLYASLLTVNSKINFDRDRTPKERESRPYLMPRTFSIWICNFNVPFCRTYHEEMGVFRRSDLGNKKALPIHDKKRYIIIDLVKFKAKGKSPEVEWLKLFTSLAKGKAAPKTSDDVIADACARLKVANASEELIMEIAQDMVTKAEISNRIHDARTDEQQKTALAMLAKNKPIEEIVEFSRLSESEILELKRGLDNPKK